MINIHFVIFCLGMVSKSVPDTDKFMGSPVCRKVIKLQEIQTMLGATKQINLLKMDIEGYEWPLLKS